MPSETGTAALYALRENIAAARDFVEGMTFDEFQASRLHVYGVTRALEIISEASRRLPEDVRQRYPDLPWRAIRDVGNLYRHEYDNVLETYLWATVKDHLSPLLAAVQTEIARVEG